VTPPQEELDEIDRRLLRALRENARVPNNRLAELAGVAPSTALQRVRSLVERGVITGFAAELDAEALGFGIQALIAVRLHPGARSRLADFARQLGTLPEVEQFFYVAGADDFVIHVRSRSTDDLSAFVTEHLSSQRVVAATNTSLIFQHSAGLFGSAEQL
jgi:DNA-binding Lrp family transcriptional regulator